jgi:hypothetical protein
MQVEGRPVDAEAIGDVPYRDRRVALLEAELDESFRQLMLRVEAAFRKVGQSRHGVLRWAA